MSQIRSFLGSNMMSPRESSSYECDFQNAGTSKALHKTASNYVHKVYVKQNYILMFISGSHLRIPARTYKYPKFLKIQSWKY